MLKLISVPEAVRLAAVTSVWLKGLKERHPKEKKCMIFFLPFVAFSVHNHRGT